MKLLILILLTVAVVFMWGDFIYARIVARHIRQWEKTITRASNGLRVGCEEFTVGDGKTAILMVHGINDSPRVWAKMARPLADQGFTCRAMRLPGFALPTERYAEATCKQWLEAVNEELSQLRQDHSRVVIVAHSLGGAVAINHLLDHPQDAEAVVLLAPAVEVSSERSPVFSTRTWHRISGCVLMFTSVTESPYANDAHDPAEKEYPWRTVFCPRSIIDQTFELLDRIAADGREFQVPMMMVLSKDDKVIDWTASQRFYDEAASTVKQLHFTEDTGHMIPVDYGWEELALQIAEFARESD